MSSSDEIEVERAEDGAAPKRLTSSRRSFLAVGGVAVGGGVVAGALHRKAPDVLDKLADRLAPASVTEDVLGTTVVVRRPKDQCYVTLAYFNCTVDYGTSPPTLVKKLNQIQCLLSVTFGDFQHQTPMHVAEEAFPLVSSHLDGSAQKPDHPNAQNNPTVPLPPSNAGPTAVDAPPVKAKYGGGTRLAFNLPDDRLPLPIDTESLLNFVGLPLIVHPNAVPPFKPATTTSPVPVGIGKPSNPEGYTAIELPYNLIVSPPTTPIFGLAPTGTATIFVNSTSPVTSPAGWTELWHTRLAALALSSNGGDVHIGINETSRELRTIRAIWCNDKTFSDDLDANKSDNQIKDPNPADPNFLSSLTYDDRYDIVRLSSDFTTDSHGGPFRRKTSSDSRVAFGYVPQPATVDNLMLTALGAWLDCDAHWDLPASPKSNHFNSSLLSWRHRVVQGRDTYVRVVRKGYLFPWGHKASLITVTERQFAQHGTNGPVGAYLRQKTFIVVTEPVKNYGQVDSLMKFHGRHLPFTSVQALTLVTPDLAKPGRYVTANDKHGHPIQDPSQAEIVFEPMVNGAFQFHFRGTDWAGDPIDFRSRVLWVDDTAAYGTNGSGPLMSAVFDKWRANYPRVSLRGQRVSVAQPKNPQAPAGDTQIVAASFELGVDLPITSDAATLISASQPNFYPAMHTVEVDLPAAKAASGNAVGTTTMQFESSHYLQHGFSGNTGGVFLRRAQTGTRHKITFSSANAGGSMTPNLAIDGLSRALGPISGMQTDQQVQRVVDGHFDPKTVFDGVDARLLGGLPLSAILGNVSFDEDDAGKALTLTSVQENEHRVVTRLDWHPTVQEGGPNDQVTVFFPTGDVENSMDLTALIITDLADPSASRSTVAGQIRDFELHLFGDGDEYFILIPFDSLTFRAQSGQKTDVDVQVSEGGVQFQGALSFVQDLASYLSFDGSGLTINTAGSEITATLTLAIPTIAVGIFSLANLAFSAGVAIPYNGDPVRFDFSFCSAENPFQLTIMIFTGGGFIELGIGADGLELLAFSFDFGLGFSIDIGIASGQVSLTGGIYYEGEKDGDHQDVTLTAWVKASGGVSALGIVSVSVELYLGLGYQSDGPGTAKLVGDAEMSISVDILFFGFTVGFDIHEEFDVSDDDSGLAAGRQRANGVGGKANGVSRKAIAADAEPPPPPTDNLFGTNMTQADWESYCTSFALIGVGA